MYGSSLEVQEIISGLHRTIYQRYRWIISILKYASVREGDLSSLINGMDKESEDFNCWLANATIRRPEHDVYITTIKSRHGDVYFMFGELLYGLKNNNLKTSVFDDLYLSIYRFTESISDYHRHLEQLRSCYDALTGLPMRKLFNDMLIRESKKDVSGDIYLLILDIDHFKSINDTYGHMVGDKVLLSMASSLRKVTRNNEPLCRYGGEEFLVILRAEEDRDAYTAGKRITAFIEKETFKIDDIYINLTITAGLTKIYIDEDITDALSRADEGLYNGKKSGRNRCVFLDKEGVVEY